MSSDRSYRLGPRAWADIEGIWRFSAETWSIRQADTYVRELTAAIALVSSMPTIARERDEFTPPVRIHVHARHLIVYTIGTDGIEVHRILGGQQDWVAILNDIEA